MAGWNHYAVKESTPQHLTRTKHSELGSVDPERMRWHNSSYRVGTTPLSLHMKHGQVILALRGPTVVKGHTVVHLAWATGRQYAWAEWWGYWTWAKGVWRAASMSVKIPSCCFSVGGPAHRHSSAVCLALRCGLGLQMKQSTDIFWGMRVCESLVVLNPDCAWYKARAEKIRKV